MINETIVLYMDAICAYCGRPKIECVCGCTAVDGRIVRYYWKHGEIK